MSLGMYTIKLWGHSFLVWKRLGNKHFQNHYISPNREDTPLPPPTALPHYPDPHMHAFQVTQLCQIFATIWTVAHQAPLSMGFSRQEYWSGLPFSSPGYLPDPGIEAMPPVLQAGSLPLAPWNTHTLSVYAHAHHADSLLFTFWSPDLCYLG